LSAPRRSRAAAPAASLRDLDVSASAQTAARTARLRYVSDCMPGIRRTTGADGSFEYVQPDGAPVRDAVVLDRIRRLGIPPAYSDVWICPIANGHLQATGRDARGRKQYRYHARWRAVRDESKYDRMIAFGAALPRLRARVDQDLRLPGLTRDRVLATVVRLLEETRIRVGNEEYVRQNHSYGLTTLRNEHVDVAGTRLRFHFRGKSGKDHAIDIRDGRVARIVRRLRELDGQELFQFVDSGTGERHHVTSDDVNGYLHDAAGEEFTAKDFRTWAGTLLCVRALVGMADGVRGEEGECGAATAHVKQNIVDAVKQVAARLGNTPAICRRCYIHPAVLEAYQDGSLQKLLDPGSSPDVVPVTAPQTAAASLDAEEAAVLAFLRSWQAPPPPAAARRSRRTRRTP
jgi:DNA topoisomerase-1